MEAHLETLASGFSWKTPKPECHVTTVLRSRLQFTFERQERRPAVNDLRQGFLPLKIVQPYVLRREVAFFICLRCACWIIELE